MEQTDAKQYGSEDWNDFLHYLRFSIMPYWVHLMFQSLCLDCRFSLFTFTFVFWGPPGIIKNLLTFTVNGAGKWSNSNDWEIGTDEKYCFCFSELLFCLLLCFFAIKEFDLTWMKLAKLLVLHFFRLKNSILCVLCTNWVQSTLTQSWLGYKTPKVNRTPCLCQEPCKSKGSLKTVHLS